MYAHVFPNLLVEGYGEALTAADEALAIFQELLDKRWEARVLWAVSVTHALKDDYEEAMATSSAAQAIFEELQDGRGIAATLLVAADMHIENKAFEHGVQAAEEAQSICERVGYKKGQAASLQRQAIAFLEMQDFDKSEKVASDALNLCRKINDKKGEAYLLRLMGQAHCERAMLAGQSLAALGDERSKNSGQGRSQKVLVARNTRLAAEKANSAAVLARWMGDKLEQAGAMLELAQAHMLKGRARQALKGCLAIEALFSDTGDVGELAESYRVCRKGAAPRALPVRQPPAYAENSAALGRRLANDPLPPTPAAQALRSYALSFAAEVQLRCVPASMMDKEKVEALATRALECAKLGAELEAETRASEILEEVYSSWNTVAMVSAPTDTHVVTQDAPAGVPPVALEKAKSGLDPEWVQRVIAETVSQAIAADGDEEELHLDSPLMENGLDSLASVAFRNALNQQFGMNLPAALMFDYPSQRAIVDRVVELSME